MRDVVDFEQWVEREADAEADADDLAFVRGAVADDADRRTVFRVWLDRVRQRSPSASPGAIHARAVKLAALVVAIAGGVVGVGLAGSLLSHDDAVPINALLFFGVSVGVQLLVLLVVAVAWLLGKAQVRVQPLHDAMLLSMRAAARLLDRLDGDRRAGLRARWAGVDLRSGRLAPLVGCQVLMTTQVFAIAFNVGLLAAMLGVYLPFVELRFGWQTTYSFGPGGVEAWVRVVSAPWTWIASGLAPDGVQIAAARYTRGQHATSLPAAAAHAWWPFLICAIVCYGLMLRAALALVAAIVLRHRLARWSFTQPAANALWRRLSGPLVVAEANDARLPEGVAHGSRSPTGTPVLLVVDDELRDAIDAVRVRVERLFPAGVTGSITAGVDDDALPADLLASIGAAVVVAVPADRRSAGRGRRLPARGLRRRGTGSRRDGPADRPTRHRARRAHDDLDALRRHPSTRGARGAGRVTADIPTFAVVGAVNHGKSSVVSALAEDDGVRVSTMPGETVVVQRFGLRDLLVFFDTPGFQNARKTLAAIDALGVADDPLDPFRRFVAAHRDDPAFEAECRLLQPVVDGAGILYVVDGSRPLRDIHLCEMEILRRTGAPRLAIVNRTGADDHVDAWRGRLNQHFNLVREFDAHRANHADRRDLVESLAIIERGWKGRLSAAVRAMDAERRQRIVEAAAVVADLLVACIGHVEKAHLDGAIADAARSERVEALRQRYTKTIATLERDAHRRLIALHAHRRVTPEATPADVFGDDLFGEETWRLFGLGMRQLVGLSGVAGGLAGAGVDAATLGHSLGIGAALGAATGAAGAWALGRKRPALSIGWPGGSLLARMAPKNALRFAGGELVVGPYKAENFPWILLDRALCVFAYVFTRSHARRDEAVPDMALMLASLKPLRLTVADWSDAERATCQRLFRVVRRGGRPGAEETAPFVQVVEAALDRVAQEEGALGDSIGSRPSPG